jgi:hypothetical protein
LDQRGNGAELIEHDKKSGYHHGQTHQPVISWRQQAHHDKRDYPTDNLGRQAPDGIPFEGVNNLMGCVQRTPAAILIMARNTSSSKIFRLLYGSRLAGPQPIISAVPPNSGLLILAINL